MAKKIGRGKPLTEVRGSVEHFMRSLRREFYRQFPHNDDEYLWVDEIFDDFLIASSSALPEVEFYRVAYVAEGEEFVFAARDEWELVELAYEPVSLQESKGGRKLTETTMAVLEAMPTTDEDGVEYMRMGGPAMTAGVINANGRRYSAEVLREAVAKLQRPLRKSTMSGKLMGLATGEAEHPTDKGTETPRVLETITRWDRVSFDGRHVTIEGIVIPTAKGRDLIEIGRAKVPLGVSMRGYGTVVETEEDGVRFWDVTSLEITGFDVVDYQWASDPDAEIAVLESRQNAKEQETMDLKELLGLLKKDPELQEGLLAELGKDERAKLAESLGVKPKDLDGKIEEAMRAQAELAERNRKDAVEKAIKESTKELPYGELNESFVEAVRADAPEDPEEVEEFVEAKRREWDGIMSKVELSGMGRVSVEGPVFEKETGIPEYAKASWQLTESMRRTGEAHRWDLRKPQTPSERYTSLMIERFLNEHQNSLQEESRRLEEAAQSSDLSLPYSVAMAVIAEALPMLVSASVFDLGMTDQAPARVYYEEFQHESGVENSVTDEEVVADEGNWVDLDYARIEHGTVVVTTDPAGTTYVEGTDYVINYAKGQIMTLAAGSISDTDDLLVDYDYLAYRSGEMQPIQRGKMTLSSQTMEIAADRLAAQISREAIVFSRSQLDYDVVGRTLTMLATKLRQKIDGDIFYAALSAVLQVANNSGGTWSSASDTLDELVQYIGYAKVKVANRYYEPTAVLVSKTNSDIISNWDGFTAAGARPDADLNAAGYVGRLKGLPVFESTEWPDTYILTPNRQLVQHRVFRPMRILGPFPSYDSNGKLISAEQYYAEEFNGTETPIPQKGAYVKLS